MAWDSDPAVKVLPSGVRVNALFTLEIENPFTIPNNKNEAYNTPSR